MALARGSIIAICSDSFELSLDSLWLERMSHIMKLLNMTLELGYVRAFARDPSQL